MQECLRRARAAGIGWPLTVECDDEDLVARLYPRAAAPARYPTPDFVTAAQGLGQLQESQLVLDNLLLLHHLTSPAHNYALG